MYEAPISRTNPGCIVFLLDRSASMSEPFGAAAGLSLAQGAVNALNSILYDLCLRSKKEPGAPPRNYFEIGVLGYGQSAAGHREAVEPALAGVLAGRPIVPIADVANYPLDIREIRRNPDLPAVRKPVWLDPLSGLGTPMCEAIATAGGHIAAWIQQHPDSYPPIVLNITDGWVTDSPYQGADLAEWARRLTSLSTTDGPTLLFNVFLSSTPAPVSYFPAMGGHLPTPGPGLFNISSPLPPGMARQAAALGIPVDESGARGLVFNADLGALVRFLDIGTRLKVSDR